MDEDTVRDRIEAWRRRAVEAHDPREQAANQLIADHYAAFAALMLSRSLRDASGVDMA